MEALIPAPAVCEVRSLIKFLKNKRRGMLSAGVFLLHDNARQHVTRRSIHLLQEFSGEVFNHPPYTPYLAPCDSHFLHLKKFLSAQCLCFQNDMRILVSHSGFKNRRQTFTTRFCLCKTSQGNILCGRPKYF